MKVLDLFSGIGGFSLGLERAGMQTIAFCEIDPMCRQVLKKHWPNVSIFEDVTKLTGDQIGYADVICGGFPCQDISIAGKGAGLEGTRSGLWYEFHRLIKEIKPRYAIIENVSALRARGLDQVLRSLAEIGYDAEWHCIPASAVGAPHQRDRVWIVAYANSGMATNGRQRQIFTQESDEWRDQPRRGDGDSGKRHIRSARQGSKNDVANTDNRSRALRGDRQFSNFKETANLWGYLRRGTQEFISRQWRQNESRPYGVANGVSNRVDRIKQLGNSVVPQIPELIGKAIIAHENALA